MHMVTHTGEMPNKVIIFLWARNEIYLFYRALYVISKELNTLRHAGLGLV